MQSGFIIHNHATHHSQLQRLQSKYSPYGLIVTDHTSWGNVRANDSVMHCVLISLSVLPVSTADGTFLLWGR